MSRPSTKPPRSGFTKVPNAVIDDPRLTPYEKVAIIKLMSHTRVGRREVYPSLATIARSMNSSITKARRTVRSLIAKGCVVVKQRGCGRRKSTRYLVIGWTPEVESVAGGYRLPANGIPEPPIIGIPEPPISDLIGIPGDAKEDASPTEEDQAAKDKLDLEIPSAVKYGRAARGEATIPPSAVSTPRGKANPTKEEWFRENRARTVAEIIQSVREQDLPVDDPDYIDPDSYVPPVELIETYLSEEWEAVCRQQILENGFDSPVEDLSPADMDSQEVPAQ